MATYGCVHAFNKCQGHQQAVSHSPPMEFLVQWGERPEAVQHFRCLAPSLPRGVEGRQTEKLLVGQRGVWRDLGEEGEAGIES